ncbi:MAG TPA: protein kinase [Candidatus Binatia bacterium]|nr:protein kinase [Candidatus Binatia bacterium]
MNLTPGTRLGAYEIGGLIGSGGMGEVYRARDTRLERTVAIKVLQGDLALSPETRQRFDREARIISSLNHPHICTLYDVGHQDGMDYLIMEYLEGESLADRLQRGALPLPEITKIGMEIADALDRAHRQGLVHRDLKPGNIVLTKGGAKLLDFGLARMTGLEEAPRSLSSPTMSRPLTAEGTIVGTFQYMAPEQLEGAEADARSDIFSFGSVLYEMASGRRAFEGKSQASLIAAILRETPAPISSIRDVIPPAVERVILRCLEKNPDDRYQTARDVLLDLKWAAEAGSRAGIPAPVAARRKHRERLAWSLAGAGLAAALLLGGFTVMNRPPEPVPLRFFAPTPKGIILNDTPKVSPDGRYVAYNASDSTGRSCIWIRPLGSLAAEPLAGTDGARRPFWSPDSRYLGFMQEAKLRKIVVQGGPPQTICDSQSAGDGTWNRNGIILFDGSPTDSIRMVSAGGGTPTAATTIDHVHGEVGSAWPHFLPDGRHFLFLGLSSRPDATTLKVGDIRSSKVVTLAHGNFSRIEYVAPGYLLFARDRSLLAQPFDTRALRFTGDPFPVVDDVAVGGGVGSNADFSSSRSTLVFRGGAAGRKMKLLWADRSGKVLQAFGAPGDYFGLSVAPDGRRVASSFGDDNADVWVVDPARDVNTRLTFDPGNDFSPCWSPDGSRIVFTSDRIAPTGIYMKLASGAGAESLRFRLPNRASICGWSRDGRFMIGLTRQPTTTWDVWVFPLDGSRAPYPFISGPAADVEPAISPDGHWISYSSNESGRWEIYMQPLDGSGGKLQVSNQGGRDAHWRADGREIFYVAPTGFITAVDVTLGPTLSLGTPRPLFRYTLDQLDPNGHYFDVSADGQRFLIRRAMDAVDAPVTTVFVNWLPKR